MTTRPGNRTATQIAAENRRARTAAAQAELAARLEVEGKVAGGPFDPTVDTDADAPPDSTPPLPSVCTGRDDCSASPHIHGCFRDFGDCNAPDEHSAEPPRPARLEDASAPVVLGPARRFRPLDRPRIVDGVIVPALSVKANPLATWVLIPVGEVASIGVTGRAVGVTPHHGRWLPLWIGDDRDERDRVLDEFAAAYAEARRSRR